MLCKNMEISRNDLIRKGVIIIMNKYGAFSFLLLVLFILLSYLLISSSFGSFGQSGRFIIISIIVLPVIGFLIGFKGKKGILKWVPIGLNFIAICSVIYIFLLAYGIGEK